MILNYKTLLTGLLMVCLQARFATFVYAVPQPFVNWVDENALKIEARGSEPLLDRCMQSGIEVRYRYEIRYCRRRSGWFDDCKENRIEVRTLQYEPISESYEVTIDRLGDEARPEKTTYDSQEDALKAVSVIDNISLVFINRGADASEKTDQDYVGVRVVSDCKESFGSRLLDISYLMTFGLVKINRFDSGWIAFQLKG